jgi:hypothetical protein
MVACQLSWYTSCVELIVPSLLHMRATGTLVGALYESTATSWFGLLEGMMHSRIFAAGDGELMGREQLLGHAA